MGGSPVSSRKIGKSDSFLFWSTAVSSHFFFFFSARGDKERKKKLSLSRFAAASFSAFPSSRPSLTPPRRRASLFHKPSWPQAAQPRSWKG